MKILQKVIALITVLISTLSFSQVNMSQLGYLDLRTMHNSDLNDIWGYTDENGNEYAIVGLMDGVSVCDVTDPANPTELAYFPGMNSIWRDIKVWDDYAYITTEANQGLQIIDLTPLPGSTTLSSSIYTGPVGNEWDAAHNIYIDDNGIAYIFGANRGNGGVIMLDVNTTPGTPVEIGTFDQWYCHDGYVRNDTGYFSHINDGFFSIVDLDGFGTLGLTEVIGSLTTSSVFTHNCWTSDDGTVLFTTDEKENGFIDSYDISDPTNPIFLDNIQSSPGDNVIPHNTYIKGNLAITSYYCDGVVVHDVSDPSNMVEVANFDTAPDYSGDTFNGCWGIFPYFASNNLIASDIEKGLYVLSIAPTLSAYLQGTVTNAGNGQPINAASIEILGTAVNDNTDVLGDYSIGFTNSGTYDVRYSANGFYADTIAIDFVTGQVVTQNVALEQIPLFNATITVIDGETSLPVENAQVRIDHTLQSFEGITDVNGEVSFDLFYEDNYDISAGQWGSVTACLSPQMLTVANNDVTLEIFDGIYDDFTFDFGWIALGTATAGDWVREIPYGTSTGGDNPTPYTDVNSDCSNMAYLTGNGGTDPWNDDVDDGYVQLSSPVFDLSGYVNPGVSFNYWFYNGFGSGTPNDDLEILMSNGTEEVQIDLLNLNNAVESDWTLYEFNVTDYLALTNTMQIKFICTDNPSGHVTKAGIDHFYIEEKSTAELNEASESIMVYPNPAKDIIFIQGIQDGTVILTDVQGKVVLTQSLIDNKLNVASVEHGLYIMQLLDEEGNLIKQQKQMIE